MNKPLWISHRGLKENAVENSLTAFRQAVSAGFTALETDLRLSKDDHIVLVHDASLERIAGDSREVSELTRLELENIQLQGGGKLLFLDEFISEFQGCSWTFDIKSERAEQLIPILAKTLDGVYSSEGANSLLRFCTWQREHEDLLRQFFPHAQFYARRLECWRAGLAVMLGFSSCGGIKADRTYALAPRRLGMSLFRRSFVKTYQVRGAQTIAFLPQSESDIKQAIHAGFDEIITDGHILNA